MYFVGSGSDVAGAAHAVNTINNAIVVHKIRFIPLPLNLSVRDIPWWGYLSDARN